MAKKGSRLREFEKNNRVLDISSKQKERQKKKTEKVSSKSGSQPEPNSTGKKKHRINWIRMGSLLVALAFLTVAALSVKNIYDLKEREASLMAENERLLQIREELEMQMKNIDSDEYIENQARRELKLVKGNELIFYFPEDFELKKQEKETGEEEEAEEE